MGDSFRTDVTLPKLLYNIGHEPNSDVKINQCARYEYNDEVQCILSATEFQRIRDSFLGPVLKATARGLNLSGKLIHCLLVRSLTTVKEKELWFHFGGQPMEFSIREFHMVTGLKCSPYGDENVEHNRYGWANTKQQHTSDELLEILRNIDRDSGDERFCLAMLLLTESIFLNMYKGNKFPVAHLKRAQDVNQFINYPFNSIILSIIPT